MEFCARISNQLMLKEIEEGVHYQNLVSSPLSINALLNMMVAGSKGDTLEYMLGFLGSKNVDEINSNSKEMMAVAAGGASSNDVEDGPILAMVNGAWADQRFPLKPLYEEDVLKGIFNCEAKNVDFRTKANEVVDEVNSWADAASRGLIKNILQRGSLTPSTSLILASGLYFKGIWNYNHKFNAACTENRDFYLLNGDTVSVPFMTSGKQYHYGSFDGFKVLKIPYQCGKPDNKFSIYFFLPDEQSGLQNLLKKFNSDSGLLHQKFVDNLRLSLRLTFLKEFWIPKFKYSFVYDVSEVTKAMGVPMRSIENPEDLSPMMHIPEGIPFFMLNVFQKAFIELDEEGTKAAAISYMPVSPTYCPGGPPREEPPSFVADHPFMFMIREEISGLIFFSGAVLNPMLGDELVI